MPAKRFVRPKSKPTMPSWGAVFGSISRHRSKWPHPPPAADAVRLIATAHPMAKTAPLVHPRRRRCRGGWRSSTR